jgi:class 3 adenylate cyclase
MRLVAGGCARALPSARTCSRQQVDPDIVLVTLDDRSVDKWPEPLAAWGGHMADAIDRVRAGGARLVALDWMQPEPTSAFFNDKFKQNDERLGQALNRMGNVVLVKSRRAGAKATNGSQQHLRFSTPCRRPITIRAVSGLCELVGEENIVATLVPGVHADARRQTLELSFPARIAQRSLQEPAELTDRHWSVQGKIDVPLREDGSLLINYSQRQRRPCLPRVLARPKCTTLQDARYTFQRQHRHLRRDVARLQRRPYIPRSQRLDARAQIPGVEVNDTRCARCSTPGRFSNPAPTPLAAGDDAVACGPGGLQLSALGGCSSGAPWGRCGQWMAFSLALVVYADYALPIVVPPDLAVADPRSDGRLSGAWAKSVERAHGAQSVGPFQDPRMVSHLLAHPQLRSGEGRECEVTVLFADLKNFTKTVESLSPGDALHQLNRYLSLMTEVIRDQYGGVIDKYLGDGLMAQWGAPELWQAEGDASGDHATCAVRACLELERRIRELSLSSGGSGDVTFGLRLTLHTGPIVAGCVGHEQRLEYTIIGDTVNVTSRLQETAKELGCDFLVSESTYHYVRDWALTGQQTEVGIRGRKQPLRVYEILAERQRERDDESSEREPVLSASE